MPRIRKGAARRRKHKRVLRAARGYYGAASRRYRIAKQSVFRAAVSATIDRKRRKRDFRSLWVTRISAACRQRGINYSQLMNGLFQADVALNRKMLSEIAIDDPAAFDKIVETAMAAVAAGPAPT
jgi:large subunit ribosomal protein L20